jgi:hypothetical protein
MCTYMADDNEFVNEFSVIPNSFQNNNIMNRLQMDLQYA